MLLGGIIVEPSSLVEMLEGLSSWRKKHNMAAELKWSKVSKQKLEEYKSLVDGFFKRAEMGHMHFCCVVFSNVNYKKYHDGNKELGFYKLYCQFLVHRLGPYLLGDLDRLVIHLDHRNTDYKLSELQRFVTRGIRKFYRPTIVSPVASIDAIDSKSHPLSDFMQVCDILLGAVGYTWNGFEKIPGASAAKIELAKHIARKAKLPTLKCATPRERSDFNIWRFEFKKGAP